MVDLLMIGIRTSHLFIVDGYSRNNDKKERKNESKFHCEWRNLFFSLEECSD